MKECRNFHTHATEAVVRPFAIVLALWTVANVVMTYRTMSGRAEDGGPSVHAVGTDGRTPVVVPPEARDAILAEMRQMLGAVQGVLAGAIVPDTAAVRMAAAKAGLVMAADPALEQILPETFLQYGMATHRAFDSLAAHAVDGPGASLTALAGITGTCVTCHATYRLESR